MFLFAFICGFRTKKSVKESFRGRGFLLNKMKKKDSIKNRPIKKSEMFNRKKQTINQ